MNAKIAIKNLRQMAMVQLLNLPHFGRKTIQCSRITFRKTKYKKLLLFIQ